MSEAKSKRPPILLLVLADLIGYLYSVIPPVIGWSVPLVLVYLSRESIYLLVSTLLLTPLFAALSFIVICFLLQRSLPKLKPGIYRPGVSKGAIVWHLNNCLGHGVEIGCLKTLIFSNKTLKWIYFRAMGAKISFGIFSSTLITFREYPLITIGEGCSISAYCHISCHTFQGDKILLAPITLGRNVFVGMKTVIGPKTFIGDDVTIGVENSLLFDTIESGSTIQNFEFEYGNPAKKAAPPHIKL